MAENIVSSMFGLTPLQVQQQQQQALNQRASEYAQMDPFQRAAYGTYQGAGMLAGAAAEGMGMVNPQVQAAQRGQNAAMGADTQTPEGLRALASKFSNAGMQQQAYMAAKAANDMEQDLAETKLKNVQATEIPAMRQEQINNAKAAAIGNMELKAEQLRIQTEQANLNREQKAELAKQHNEVLLTIASLNGKTKSPTGEPLTQGQIAADKEFGKSYADYQAGGGSADIEKQLTQLDTIATELKTSGNNYTGPIVGNISPSIRALTNPEAVNAQNQVEEVAQRNLRLVLGAQFTQVEGERLIARAYNPTLDPSVNAKRVEALSNQIRIAAKTKEDAARYFEQHGTLAGWKGRIPTFNDIKEAMDNVDKKTTELKSMPSPKGMEGKTVRDTVTGKRYKSDGTSWKAI